MYLTRNMLPQTGEGFDWSQYFAGTGGDELIKRQDTLALLMHLRNLLGESRPQFTFVLTRMLRSLFRGLERPGGRVLELGAGTGFLTRWLVNEHKMFGRLVDNNAEARQTFEAMTDETKQRIEYVMSDLFTYASEERFDIVCSFGVIEHFADKTDIIRAHTRHLREDGKVVLLVPMDTVLSRVYYEVYPELNLGYRELWTAAEFREILSSQGLEVLRLETTRGYSYDMMGAVCQCTKRDT